MEDKEGTEAVKAAVSVATTAETEDREEARVGVVLAQEMVEPKVPRGCGCAMKRIFPPCPLRTRKNHAPFW